MELKRSTLHNCVELTEYINQVGFLPLLESGIPGWSAEEAVDDDCRYVALPGGGWKWPLWDWKGSIIQESGCAYGKFFGKKAAFISSRWWPDFCNYRRSRFPHPRADSIEEAILFTLKEKDSFITRDLRAACGFTGVRMRSKFDAYLARLEMGGYIVIKDFVYPTDSHGRKYGWGWAVLTTPESFLGKSACTLDCPPEESYTRLFAHFKELLPGVSERTIRTLIG